MLGALYSLFLDMNETWKEAPLWRLCLEEIERDTKDFRIQIQEKKHKTTFSMTKRFIYPASASKGPTFDGTWMSIVHPQVVRVDGSKATAVILVWVSDSKLIIVVAES